MQKNASPPEQGSCAEFLYKNYFNHFISIKTYIQTSDQTEDDTIPSLHDFR